MKPEISYDDFSKLELRVATVLSAREHPNADKLLLLQIDAGEGQRQIVVLVNLEEAMLRGEESQGMLLAAGDGDDVVLLQPDRECTPGAAIK